MSVLAICPHCLRSITIEKSIRLTCPECGEQLGFAELQRKRLVVDQLVESAELSEAREFFGSGEYRRALEHFSKALEANPNSYAAKYFVLLCNIYLQESEADFDYIGSVVDMIRESLTVMSRANVHVKDKLSFITAMLSETKVLIVRRFDDREELFRRDIKEYRRQTIADLKKLLALLKIDGEIIMSFSREVTNVLSEITETAIKACYKAVQTVSVDDKLLAPADDEYAQIQPLCSEYCYFAQQFNPYFDSKNYSPDFSQNNALNEKVFNRLDKFDEENRQYAKKNVIGNIDEYESILKECEKALNFTYLNCYRSMCSRQNEQHAHLFVVGLDLLYRLLLPRVIVSDKKKVEIRNAKFVDMVDWCDMLTRFLVDSYDYYEDTAKSLHEFYEKLYDITKMYFVPEFDRIDRSINKLKETRGENYDQALKFLFNGACCCALALEKYIDFSDGRDNTRAKLVKICKQATDDFFLLCDYNIDGLEQSNVFRPILKVSSALMEESSEQ